MAQTVANHWKRDVEARLKFHARVQPNGCIEWSGFRDKDGYGKITVNYRGTLRRAHGIA